MHSISSTDRMPKYWINTTCFTMYDCAMIFQKSLYREAHLHLRSLCCRIWNAIAEQHFAESLRNNFIYLLFRHMHNGIVFVFHLFSYSVLATLSFSLCRCVAKDYSNHRRVDNNIYGHELEPMLSGFKSLCIFYQKQQHHHQHTNHVEWLQQQLKWSLRTFHANDYYASASLTTNTKSIWWIGWPL